MSMLDKIGLFKPFTHRMSKARKRQLIKNFLERGSHNSPSGFTARLVVEFCEAHDLEFTVVRRVEHHAAIGHYAVIIDSDTSRRGLECLSQS